jgi:tetratricopeptide (TPR) repeat protein
MAWKGDTAAARASFEEAPPGEAWPVPEVFIWFSLDTLERQFEAALARLESTPHESFESQFGVIPKTLLLGFVYRQLDQAEKAHSAFEGARIVLEERLRQDPEDHRLHSALGIAYAGLGRKDEAIRKGKRGVELLPLSRDAHVGPDRVRDLALIYTMVGEPDAALDQIEQLLSIPANFSVPLLELHPQWDPLRAHPRYQEIVKKYALFTSGTT